MILAENDIGFLVFDGNELTVGSKIGDPPKVRLTSPIMPDGGGGGVVSYNASRQAGVVCDGHQQTEMAMDRVEQAEDVRGQQGNFTAERNFLVSDASGDGADGMHKPFAFTCDTVTHDTLGLSGSASGSAPVPFKLVSADGRYEMTIQGDGNFVTYDLHASPPKAIWSSFGGRVR
jgi:hypothetical protein